MNSEIDETSSQISQPNIPSSSGEAATDSGGDTPSSSSSEAAVEVSQPNISQPTKNSLGGFRGSEEQFHNQIIYEPKNFLGEFREGEVNGKPFHIFTTSLSQTDNLPSSSGGDDLPPPLFICPVFPFAVSRSNDHNGNEYLPLDVYPHFFDERSGDQQFQYMIGSKIYHHECKLPLVPLFWCNNKEANSYEFHCGACGSSELGTYYYFCVGSCGWKFHKECIECPLEIKHPSYPFTSLKICSPPRDQHVSCFRCQTTTDEMLYHCPTKKITMHPICALKPIPIVIDHPKRHPHPLTFFPKQHFLPCDVCGLIKDGFPTYVCARCVFVVHQDCVFHPYVIRICRHQHRISFTYSLPSGKWSCGVCRRSVDNNYGAYSCNKCDDYFVHTKCALRKDLWDGEELEGIPEEPEIVAEPPFERISEGIILHFIHGHHLKLEMSKFYDEDKFCQACVLPIYGGGYYSCMDECDFILHEACANAPRRKHHPLHAYPLTLKVVTKEYNDEIGYFSCDACRRNSCGFVYEDETKSDFGFYLDLRCALVSEPFKYEGHEHPLFLALTPQEEESTLCQICQEKGDENNWCKKLTCIDCNYIICFACATLPYKAMYKHDKHLLTFRKKEEASVDHSGWCEACEDKIEYSKKGGYYSCDDYCSTTLHVDCLLGGEDIYMKPGHTILRYGIFDNKTMTRPFCHGTWQFCNRKEHRCPHRVVFKNRNGTFCSFYCLPIS